MKHFLTIALICSFSVFTFAADGRPALQYHVRVNDQGYILQMALQFSTDVSLAQVKNNLKSGYLLSKINPQVLAILIQPTGKNSYEQITQVKSFGFRSDLRLNCQESENRDLWSRSCVMDVGYGGGKYMVWKKDQITCKETPGLGVRCETSIEGLAKPLVIAGIPLLSAKKFMVKLKYQALQNFAMLWAFTNQASLDIDKSVHEFREGPWQVSLDLFQEKGLHDTATGDFQFEDQLHN